VISGGTLDFPKSAFFFFFFLSYQRTFPACSAPFLPTYILVGGVSIQLANQNANIYMTSLALTCLFTDSYCDFNLLKMDVRAALDFGLAKLKIQKFKENQKEVVKAYLSGHDVLMVAPTGSGKSLVFQIAPFVLDFLQNGAREECEAICLVIAPLVSLMKDQVEILSTLGINAAVIGPESSDEVNRLRVF